MSGVVKLKQIGYTCGIYSLLNGLYRINDNANSKIAHSVVYDILDETVYKVGNPDSKRMTLVGEFFDIKLFEEFIRNNISQINLNLTGKTNSFKVSLREIEYLKSHELKSKLQTREAFVLFSIPGRKFNSSLASHWICIIDNNGKNNEKFKVINSTGGKMQRYTFEELSDKHYELEDSFFNWNDFKYKRIVFRKINKLAKSTWKNIDNIFDENNLEKLVSYTTGNMIVVEIGQAKNSN